MESIKYHTLKIPLKKIISKDFKYDVFIDSIKRTNKIVFYTYFLLRIWILKKYHSKENIPIINKQMINLIFDVIKTKTNRGRKKEKNEEDTIIFNEFTQLFKDIFNEDYVDGVNLSQILNYVSIEIITNFENNLKLHFVNRIKHYVNEMFKDENKKKKELKSELFYVKNDIIKGTLKSDEKYHLFINKFRDFLPIINNKKNDAEYNNKLKNLKNDLFDNNNYVSEEIYHKWLNENKYILDDLPKVKIKSYRTIKNDLFSYDDKLNSEEIFHEWIKKHKDNILKNIPIEKTSETLYSDVFKNPQKYLIPTIKMNNDIENLSEHIEINKFDIHFRKTMNDNFEKYDKKELNKKMNDGIKEINKISNNKLKLFQFCPLKKSIIQNYVMIDTKSIIEIIHSSEDITKKDIDKWTNSKEWIHERKNLEGRKQFFLNNLDICKSFIWNKYFKMKHNIFKNYSFDYVISTDGISASLQFIDNKSVEQKNEIKKRKKEAQKQEHIIYGNMSKDEKTKIKEEIKKDKNDKKIDKKVIPRIKHKEIKYLDELEDNILEDLKYKNKIYIDPGKRTLLTMIDDRGNKMNYTNGQRLFETKRIKYDKIKENYRKQNGMEKKESKLSEYSSKSCNMEKFIKYAKEKQYLYETLFEKYNCELFRKLKWYSYINKKKSESKLVNNMVKTFGNDSVIIMGDWSIGKQMKNFISTPNKGIKRKLHEKFEIYDMDEFRTSTLGLNKEERCGKLSYVDKIGKTRELHSVLTYKMLNNKIGCINRDNLGVKNIRKIALEWIIKKEIPLRFRRGYRLEETSERKIVCGNTKNKKENPTQEFVSNGFKLRRDYKKGIHLNTD